MSKTAKKNKVVPLYRDLVFKHIFGTKKNKRFTQYLLERYFGLEEGSLKDIEILNSVRLNPDKIYDKKFETDVIVKLPNEELINLEMYNDFDDTEYVKSELYACKLFSTQLKSGKKYVTTKKVMQINFIRKGKIKRDEANTLFSVRDNKNNMYAQNEYLEICDINIDYEKHENDGIPEGMRDIIEFMNSDNEDDMKKIARKDKVIEEMYEEMQAFSENDFIEPFYDRDALMRTGGLNEGLKKGEKKGLKKGRKEGLKEGLLTVAKNMLQGNFPLEDISRATKLTIEEIKSIENNK